MSRTDTARPYAMWGTDIRKPVAGCGTDIRKPCAPGTGVGYAPMLSYAISCTRLGYPPMQCAVLRGKKCCYQAVNPPMQCPVVNITSLQTLKLFNNYITSVSNDIGNIPVSRPTGTAFGSNVLCACYAMSGADLAYAPTRRSPSCGSRTTRYGLSSYAFDTKCPVLRWCRRRPAVLRWRMVLTCCARVFKAKRYYPSMWCYERMRCSERGYRAMNLREQYTIRDTERV
eukprot:919417-Rhodomonas_salina.2